jgi:hypothetical protein
MLLKIFNDGGFSSPSFPFILNQIDGGNYAISNEPRARLIVRGVFRLPFIVNSFRLRPEHA